MADRRRRPPPPGRALIDARAAVRVQIGGVERWTRELVARLPGMRPGAYEIAAPPRVLAHRAGHAWEQAALPLRAAASRAGVVVCPANLGPLAWPRNLVLLHDVAALRHPQWYSRAYSAWQRAVIPAVARRARVLATVSRFSRAEIAETLSLDPERIEVVPGGVSEAFHPSADPARARRELDLRRPYVLTLATVNPRKNRPALAAAAAALAEQGIELVAAGGRRGYMREDAAGGAVRELGYVPDRHLPGLYAGARAFALVSLHEGFGLPCLEAMASGTPVVAADRAALPETCGDSALLVEPEDPGAIAEALVRAACEEALRERLRTAGLARAAELTWDRAAHRIDELVQRVGPG